jgi:hypothetical protein
MTNIDIDMTPTTEQEVRYAALLHAVQTGVAQEQHFGSKNGTPKHLRVGVNSALVECAALGRLLVAKGVISKDEYYSSIIFMLEQEVKNYEERLEAKLGLKVSLL